MFRPSVTPSWVLAVLTLTGCIHTPPEPQTRTPPQLVELVDGSYEGDLSGDGTSRPRSAPRPRVELVGGPQGGPPVRRLPPPSVTVLQRPITPGALRPRASS
jgi:hypothetical protein